jgi:formylglycine-generating enzyme required for sulfatase activity
LVARITGKSYRLLSEAEREYVTRAGRSTPFWWGDWVDTSLANYDGSRAYGRGATGGYLQRTVTVESFSPNDWGLFNVHGNVWDWTEDCRNESNRGNPGDGSARVSGDCSFRVLRGGSWNFNPWNVRSAYRNWYDAELRVNRSGFRVARTLE